MTTPKQPTMPNDATGTRDEDDVVNLILLDPHIDPAEILRRALFAVTRELTAEEVAAGKAVVTAYDAYGEPDAWRRVR